MTKTRGGRVNIKLFLRIGGMEEERRNKRKIMIIWRRKAAEQLTSVTNADKNGYIKD